MDALVMVYLQIHIKHSLGSGGSFTSEWVTEITFQNEQTQFIISGEPAQEGPGGTGNIHQSLTHTSTLS